jgi:DNA polymerase III epsilon subunit-like protein
MRYPASNEIYICVDIEASGPVPGDYSLLSIGACTVFEPRQTFYIELQPVNENTTQEAAKVHHLSLQHLMDTGVPPQQALARFEAWLQGLTPPGTTPLLVAFNAPFDWMFVNDYFHRFLGRNPFGHAALDIKAFYMGFAGAAWEETTMRHVSDRFLGRKELTHHALRDAMDQADIFSRMLEAARLRSQNEQP